MYYSLNIKKNYDKKIREKIMSLVDNVDSNEGIQYFLDIPPRKKFNTLLEWSQSFEESLAIIYSFVKIKVNEIEYIRNEHIETFNDTWLVFIIISTINLEVKNSFLDYDENQMLSGRFEYFIDEETGWYVLYYISNDRQGIFCGLYESEEVINHLVEICYSLQINVDKWDNQDYLLSIIEGITGNFYDTEAHSEGVTSKIYYYDILGVSEDATQDEIKQAYRRKCREYHPDVYKNSDANEIMSKINEAYDNLKK